MSIELRILTGKRGGQRERFDKRVIALGRHLQSDLRFDPNGDLDVSSRHAEILGNATSGYRIRDTQSTNGTFVNGRRIDGDEQLYDGDVIWLGTEGPRVEVRIAGEAGQRAVGPDGVKETVVRSSQQRPSTGERVKVAVRRETASMRRLLGVAVVLLIGGIGAAYWIGHRESSSQVSELMQLLAQSDSTASRLQSQLRTIGDTTFASILRRQNAELAARVRSTSPTATQVELDSLKDELRRRQVMQQGIALLDLSKISVQNDAAVAFLVTELDGKPYGGTAFGITSRGLLVTNRHNVRSPVTGRPTTRLGVKYANTDVLLHAHVVQVADSNIDLALVQVDEPGTYPVIAGVARGTGDLHAGSPVVTIGFPHALDVPMEGNIVKTSLTAGTVSKLLPDVVQIDAYASHGSSGSPIFDANGWVIGIIYGGDPQSQGRITYAVPSAWLDGMLKGEARAVLRP